ncbi:hypothetical protein Pelo_9761 [Pelomyxa schiedti]|nr:hypothetical protein Pelo_9761 [Pelomyxa schiedti]
MVESIVIWPDLTVREDYDTNLEGLLRAFSWAVSGYTFCNSSEGPGVQNAVSIAGLTSTVVATPVTLSLVRKIGLSAKYNADSGTPSQLYNHFRQQWSNSILCHQNSQLFLADYAVFTGAFMFWDSQLDTDLALQALDHLVNPGAVLGW